MFCWFRFEHCEVTTELNYDEDIDPVIEVVYETNDKKVFVTKGLSFRELQGRMHMDWLLGESHIVVTEAMQTELRKLELETAMNIPENEEENPYLQLAKQQQDKIEGKRRKMMAMEGRK